MVAADVHVSPEADSDVTDDVNSAGSCQAPGRYRSSTVGSLRRRDRLRSSLPVVSAMNKSMERPLGSYTMRYVQCLQYSKTRSVVMLSVDSEALVTVTVTAET